MKEVLSNIGFDWQVALSNFVTFLIIFYILKKYVFTPMGKTLEARKKKIDEGLYKAEQSQEELLHARKIAQEEVAKAKEEANRIIAEAQKKSDAFVAASEDRAKVRIEEEERKMRERIEQEKREASVQLQQEHARFLTKALKKILLEEGDAELDARYRNHILELTQANQRERA